MVWLFIVLAQRFLMSPVTGEAILGYEHCFSIILFWVGYYINVIKSERDMVILIKCTILFSEIIHFHPVFFLSLKLANFVTFAHISIRTINSV